MKKNPEHQIPHSAEAEEAALGSLLIDPAAHPKVSPLLAAGDFYIQKNGWLYEAIDAAARNGGVDIVTVADHLERKEQLEDVGGMAYLTHLLNAVPSALHAEEYARMVSEYATRRRLIHAAGEVARAAYDEAADISEAQARAEGAVIGARRDGGRRQVEGAGLAQELFDRFDTWQNNPLGPGEVRGLATGIAPLDTMLGGLESGYYVVAGRPSMGKTALLLQMIEGIAGRGERCMLFTIEMSAAQVGERLATSMARVELQALKQGRAFPEEHGRVLDQVSAMADWPLTVIDQSTLRPGDVLAAVRREEMTHGPVSAVFVDGLWLMTPTRERENRTQTVGSISRELKRIQRELDVPLLVAHQLNRGVEQRADKRPLLSDLRDSGDVEQDTDVVLMLYREGQYDKDSKDANVLEIWVRKNRLGGPAGECVYRYWVGKYMRCEPLTHYTETGRQ